MNTPSAPGVTSQPSGEVRPIRPYLRQLPHLSPEDSVERAVRLLRLASVDALPVLSPRGQIIGVLGFGELRASLADTSPGAGMAPVSAAMAPPDCAMGAEASLDDVRAALANGPRAVVFIKDRGSVYVGGITAADLLAPDTMDVRPASAGGMATPWGVYLTSSGIQAGVGNGALVGAGATLGALASCGVLFIGLTLWLLQHFAGGHTFDLWSMASPPASPTESAEWVLLQAAAAPVFLLVLRMTPIAGYHGAEHQAVHAIERGERLDPDLLARMPRVHPRCGSNLVAAFSVFGLCARLIPCLRIPGVDAADAALIGLLCAALTWRRAGAFVQQRLTTRPTSQRERASGVRAARQLLDRYAAAPPLRQTLLRRIWCMGMLQMLLGVSAGAGVGLYVVQEIVNRLP